MLTLNIESHDPSHVLDPETVTQKDVNHWLQFREIGTCHISVGSSRLEPCETATR